MQYRKKATIIIEAFKWLGELTDPAWPLWFQEAVKATTVEFDTAEDPMVMYITTLEGTMKATAGDYIIRGVKGELYPCKPDIFETLYEVVPYVGYPSIENLTR
jgi:hypothetical protein